MDNGWMVEAIRDGVRHELLNNARRLTRLQKEYGWIATGKVRKATEADHAQLQQRLNRLGETR